MKLRERLHGVLLGGVVVVGMGYEIVRTVLGRPGHAESAADLEILARGAGRYVLRNVSGQTITGLTAKGVAGFDEPGGVTMPDQAGREFLLVGGSDSVLFKWDGGQARVPVPFDMPG